MPFHSACVYLLDHILYHIVYDLRSTYYNTQTYTIIWMPDIVGTVVIYIIII